MSERMRIAGTICAIAAVGIAAFMGLRALASGSGQPMRESGLVVPSQSEGSAAQSDPGTAPPPAGPEPTGHPTDGPAVPGPVPAPTAPEAPYQVTPSQPQRATSDDDDDHHDHDHDDKDSDRDDD